METNGREKRWIEEVKFDLGYTAILGHIDIDILKVLSFLSAINGHSFRSRIQDVDWNLRNSA